MYSYGDWYKLFAYGVDRERNWVGVILKEEYVNAGNVQDHEFEAGQILMSVRREGGIPEEATEYPQKWVEKTSMDKQVKGIEGKGRCWVDMLKRWMWKDRLVNFVEKNWNDCG